MGAVLEGQTNVRRFPVLWKWDELYSLCGRAHQHADTLGQGPVMQEVRKKRDAVVFLQETSVVLEAVHECLLDLESE